MLKNARDQRTVAFMLSFFQDPATAETDSEKDYDSDETVDMGDTDEILAKANSMLKPGLNDKSTVAYQTYEDADVSRHLIMKGGSRYLFLKHTNTRASVIVHYTGTQAVEGSTPGDLFKSNTIKRYHLTGEETKALEKTFQVQPDGIVALDNHIQRTAWRERLVTYFLLLESNMFTPSIDVVGKADRQKFLYDFLAVRSPLSRLDIARKFRDDIVRVYGDVGVLNDVGTVESAPKRKRKKLSSSDDLLKASKALQFDLVTLKPKPKPKPVVQPELEPQRAITPPPQSKPTPFNAAQGIEASRELGFELVTLKKAQASAPEASAPAQESEEEETLLTPNQGIEASRQLGFDLVTLRKKL